MLNYFEIIQEVLGMYKAKELENGITVTELTPNN